MKTIRSIIAAALTLILTTAFILFPDFYYRRDESSGALNVRKIDVFESSGSAALSEQEIFAALLNENSERSLCYFSEIPDSKQNDCYITARKMIREILFKPSLRAYSYFTASEVIIMTDMKKLRYLTLSENTENGDIQTIDLILVSVGSCAVCYEEKSNLPVFFTVSGYVRTLILEDPELEMQIISHLFEYYEAHGLIDCYKTLEVLPPLGNYLHDEELSLIVYMSPSNDLVFGCYPFMMRVEEFRDLLDYGDGYEEGFRGFDF